MTGRLPPTSSQTRVSVKPHHVVHCHAPCPPYEVGAFYLTGRIWFIGHLRGTLLESFFTPHFKTSLIRHPVNESHLSPPIIPITLAFLITRHYGVVTWTVSLAPAIRLNTSVPSRRRLLASCGPFVPAVHVSSFHTK